MPEYKVLVVDDDYSFAEFAKAILESRGYTTVVCLEGEKALELAVSEKPDVVLMDLGLPDVHGLEVIRRLKEKSTTQAILVIVCSMSHNDSDMEYAAQFGGAGYIRKPLKLEELDLRIRAAVGRPPEDINN